MVAPAPNENAQRGAVVGLVLCGGQSRRMGRDKARVEWQGETLLRSAVRALKHITADVRLACGAVPRYAEEGLALIVDRVPEGGPLAGIEAALFDLEPNDRLVCVACDMPTLDPRLLAALVERSWALDIDVACARTNGGIEPLISVWRASMAVPARAAFERGQKRVVAAFDQPFTDGARPRVQAFSAEELGLDFDAEACARNVNSPADLRAQFDGVVSR